MALANLFSPNDYRLFCKTMSFGGTSPVYAILGEPQLLTDVGGCITQADFLTVSYFRLNDIVTIRWAQIAPNALATAATSLRFTEAISPPFRPPVIINFPCALIGDNVGVLTQYPGIASVDTLGVVTFTFMNCLHGANPNWAIGERVGVLAGTITYTTLAALP